MTPNVMSIPPPAVAGPAQAAGRLVDAVRGHARRGGRANPFRRIIAVFEDVVLLMLAVFLLPFTILLVGAPIALCLRAVIEIVRRVS